jgi:hypothetical protein
LKTQARPAGDPAHLKSVKDVNSIPHAKKITTREGINIGHLRGMSTRNATSGHRMARSRRPERPGMTRPVLNA